MRTTLTFDPDVAVQVKETLASSSKTLKDIVNETMRKGFSVPPPQPPVPYKVVPFSLHLPPEIGYGKLNQYLDDLEVEDFLEKSRRDELRWKAEQGTRGQE